MFLHHAQDLSPHGKAAQLFSLRIITRIWRTVNLRCKLAYFLSNAHKISLAALSVTSHHLSGYWLSGRLWNADHLVHFKVSIYACVSKYWKISKTLNLLTVKSCVLLAWMNGVSITGVYFCWSTFFTSTVFEYGCLHSFNNSSAGAEQNKP